MTAGKHRASKPSSYHSRRLAAWCATGYILAALTHTQPPPDVVAPQPNPAPARVVVLTQPPATRVAVMAALKINPPHRQLKVIGRQGLTPNAVALLSYIDDTYPAVTTVGGVRPDPIPDHPTGHAIDVMITNPAVGQQICDDLLAQARRFHIRYLIWQQTLHRPNGSHYLMADRGSPNANHFTHLHVTVF